MIRSTILALAAATTVSAANAATFRVTTKIYQGPQPQPIAEHWILFDDGVIYNLPQKIDRRFVTVFDPSRKRVTLLDRQDRLQTTLMTDDLLTVTADARARAKTVQRQQQIGLDATVQPSQKVDGHTIRFPGFEYHTTTQTPDDPAVATDYGKFALLTSQLGIIRRIGPPPFARMTLNQFIAGRGQLPLETSLTVRRGDQTQELRSTHQVSTLSEDDRAKINEVHGMMALFREVKLKEFGDGQP